jgi:hypothetical protein
MPWLVPPTVAACCPNLQRLCLQSPRFHTELDAAVVCASLTCLHVHNCETALGLPLTDCHLLSAALPNVTELNIMTSQSIEIPLLMALSGSLRTTSTMDLGFVDQHYALTSVTTSEPYLDFQQLGEMAEHLREYKCTQTSQQTPVEVSGARGTN